jgi:putative ABC transport system permease protein
MTHATLVWRNLARRRQRTALTVVAVGLCLFLFTSLVTVLETLDAIAARSRTHKRVIVHARASMSVPMPASYETRLAKIPGVEAVMPMVMALGFGRTEGFLVGAAAVEPDAYEKVMYEQLPLPEELARFKRERTSAIAAPHVFEKERLKIGDRYEVRTLHRPLTIELTMVGKLRQNLNPTTLFFHRKYYTEIAGDHGANMYFLKVASLDVVPAVVEAVDREFENDPVPVDAEPEHAMVDSFLVAQGTVLALVRGVGVLVLISITLVVGNTMAMSVRERTHEVGVLKTLGFPTHRLLALLLGESVLLTLAGGALGSAAAFVVLGQGFSAGYGPLSNLSVQWRTVALGLSASLAVGLLAGGYPAWRAARMPVVSALRRVV